MHHNQMQLILCFTLFALIQTQIFSDKLTRPMPEIRIKVDAGKIAFALYEFKNRHSRYPTEKEGLILLSGFSFTEKDSIERKEKFLENRYLFDPWHRPYLYRLSQDDRPEVITLGADGLPGGTEENRDILILTELERDSTIEARHAFSTGLILICIELLLILTLWIFRRRFLFKYKFVFMLAVAATLLLYFLFADNFNQIIRY